MGWFGFNAGSEPAADGVAGMAMAVTQLATAAAALTWMFSKWVSHGKSSVLGIASGVVCFLASTKIKRALGYDDSLDVFGIHCIGGIVGALLTGIFCAEAFGGAGFGDGNTSIGGQLMAQTIGVVATLVYTFVVTFIVLRILDATIGLRVTEDDEQQGLDLALHDERGYIL